MTTEPFTLFDDAETIAALNALAEVKHLVLYCGAGATIDRTGASWEELISLLIPRGNRGTAGDREAELVQRVVRESSGEEGGTIAWATLAANKPDPHAALDRALGTVLYEKVGWSQGLLLEKLAQLAVAARFADKRVTVVTTNYDIYIEEELNSHLRDIIAFAREMEADLPPGGVPFVVPGLRIRAHRRPKSFGRKAIERVVLKGYNTSDAIEIVYLHGRIGKTSNEGNSHIILSENDYALSHRRTVDTLLPLLGRESGLVIIGSSLRDKPLVEALVRCESSTKYVLIRLTTWLADKRLVPAVDGQPAPTRSSATEILRRRGLGLGGLRFIATDNHEQISQFVEELRLAIEAKTYESQRWPVPKIAYTQRLMSWFSRWSKDRPEPVAEYDSVARFLRSHQGHNQWFEPETRIEVWARESGSVRSRRLQLACCSSGPLMPTHVPRTCSLEDNTVAAARAFNEGRPLILSLEDLGLRSDASRWQKFLAVPIFAGFSMDDGPGYFAAAPVGVVVAAATRLDPRFDTLESADKTRLIHDLVDLGLSILRGDEDEGETD